MKSPELPASELVVSQPVELPPGAAAVETTLSLPPGSVGQCVLNVLENGQAVPGLPARAAVPLDLEIGVPNLFPRVLAVGASGPDFGELAAALSMGVNLAQMPFGGPRIGGMVGTRTFAWRPRSQLPRRWIDNSGADLVCITLADLAALRAEDREAFEALRDWVASGGNLVVSGAGRQQERLAAVESLLGMEPLATGEPGGRAGWKAPDPKLRTGRLPAERLFPKTDTEGGITAGPEVKSQPPGEAPSAAGASKAAPEPGGAAAGDARARPPAKPPPGQPSAEDGLFWLRPYYWGMVVAVGPEGLWPGTAARWRWMLNALGHDRWLWDRRHGVSVIDDNPEFWSFLIPGVGLAPVVGFEVLITVFVLAVGPVNYLLLRRAKRLHLMVVTVPASALVATGLLLVFGLVSDGLSTRVRVRSITYLDQRQGRALCWARLSYYAGVAPRGGLRFPADTLVIPYLPEPRSVSESPGRRQVFQWGPQEQWLRSGWLASRTPTQFITLRTRPTTLGLEVVPAGSGAWEVRNRLGTRIHKLLVRTSQGQYFQASEIEPGGACVLEPAGSAPALGAFLPPYLAGPTPTYPGWSTPRRWRYRRYSWSTITDALWRLESDSRTSRAESRLAGLISQSPLWVSDFKSPGLGPGSYAAVVERSPEVELGTDLAREVAGFHLVLGVYAETPGGASGPPREESHSEKRD